MLVRQAEAMRTPTLRQKYRHTCGYVSLRQHVFHWQALPQFELEAVALTFSHSEEQICTLKAVFVATKVYCAGTSVLWLLKKTENQL